MGHEDLSKPLRGSNRWSSPFESTRSSDRDFTATIGWLWRGANWSLGGAYRQGGDDVLHLNAGAGLAFRDGQWQLDGAIDHSDHGTIASVSMVFAY